MDIMEVMTKVRIADKHLVASLQTRWKEGVSRVNNTYKYLMDLVQLGRLVKGPNYFKVPECESEYKPHAELLSKSLIEILKVNPEAEIWREHYIQEISLRPDALVLMRQGNLARMLIVEVCESETEEYLMAKVNLWKKHPEALRILSEITKIMIPAFDIVVVGKDAPNGTITLNYALEGS
jgi:hypothetical protein